MNFERYEQRHKSQFWHKTINFLFMKYFIQFKTLSTGYIKGTIPPQFSKENIKPIDKLGSDGIYYLDNRLSIDNMINKGFELCKQKNNTVGFSLVRYNGTILNGKEVKTIIF